MEALLRLNIPKPVPERITRKEQALKAQAQATGGDPDAMDVTGDGGGGAGLSVVVEERMVDPATDPYDVVDPKEILPLLTKEFWEGLESKKWNERKAQLTVLKDHASYPRLAGREGDYSDVLRELKKVVAKDVNVLCCTEALLCLSALAQGLRSAFSLSARSFVEPGEGEGEGEGPTGREGG